MLIAVGSGGHSSTALAGLAGDFTAALADPAGAATAHAGLLHHRGCADVVNRNAFSEIHLKAFVFVSLAPESERDIIDAALKPRREIA
jgi:hypothetical protein